MKPWILAVILISAAAFLIISYLIFASCIFNMMFKRMKKEILLTDVDLSKTHYKPVMDKVINNMHTFMALPYEEVSIVSKDGLKLYGKYYRNGESTKTCFFCHGYHADPYNNINTMGLSLLEHGYNILLITERSHGKSEGKYITFGVKEQEDILLWSDFLNKTYHPSDVLVWGVSMGCASVEMASDRFPSNVKVMVLDCGFTGAYEQIAYSMKSKVGYTPHLLMACECVLCRLKGGFILKKGEAKEHLKKNKIPAYFVHGKGDKMVPYSMGAENYEACASKKTMLSCDCGHAMSIYYETDKYMDGLYDFLKDYIK